MQSIKCVVVGTRGSGKTSLLITYSCGTFPAGYVPTVFDNYSANVIVDGKPINLGLWDTADVFLLCFNVDDESHFNEVWDGWYYEIDRHCPSAPIVLVGTKSDLRHTSSAGQCVHMSQGIEMARKIGAAAYCECSALTGSNIQPLFECCIRLVIHPKIQKEKKKKKGIMSQVKSFFKSSNTKITAPSSDKSDLDLPAPSSSPLLLLPPHVLQHAFTFLDASNLVKCCRVSGSVKKLADSDDLWIALCKSIDHTFDVKQMNSGGSMSPKLMYQCMCMVWLNDWNVPKTPPPPFSHVPVSFGKGEVMEERREEERRQG